MSLKTRNNALAAALMGTKTLGDAEVRRAMSAAEATSRTLEETLLELGVLPEDDLAAFLSKWIGLPRADGRSYTPFLETSWDISREYLTNNNVCPCLSDEGEVILMMVDPRDADVVRMLEYASKKRFAIEVATRREITQVLARTEEDAPDDQGDAYIRERDIDQLAQSSTEGPVVRLVQAILLSAIDERASDVHVEADEAGGVVRLRVDGALAPERRLNDVEIRAVQSRLKLIAGLNITELRRPQDGRIRQTLRGVPVDFRLSTLPTQFGESLVMRVLDQRARPLNLEQLGFRHDRLVQLDGMFRRTEGLFLVTGPTGSGKTTTLYTGLSRLDATTNKIITIEDPVEFTLDGICQTQVQTEIGYDFGHALRAVLRQDINVVLVGEIRDPETAQQAIRIAMTGRLVASTLHTSTAIAAVDRLRDLQIPDYLIASTLRGVLSQRLVPRADGGGRTVVSELFEVNDKVAAAIADGTREAGLLALARETGFITMREEGQRLADAGVISEEDLRAVLFN